MVIRYLIVLKTVIFFLQVQPKPGVISSVGGMTLGKGGVQIQMLGTGQAQMPAPQPPAAVQTHVRHTSFSYSALCVAVLITSLGLFADDYENAFYCRT